MWLLTHKQKEVQAVLRKFRKLPPNKQILLDKKLLYLVSILDHAFKSKNKSKSKTQTRCKSCGYPMHVRVVRVSESHRDAGRAAELAAP